MRESGYYPPGAEFDPNAPWNQSEPEPKEFDCEVVVTVSTKLPIPTTSYYVEAPEPPDYMGGVYLDDYVDWKDDYYENNYELPVLLEKMADMIKKWMPNDLKSWEKVQVQNIIEQAMGWELIDTEIDQL